MTYQKLTLDYHRMFRFEIADAACGVRPVIWYLGDPSTSTWYGTWDMLVGDGTSFGNSNYVQGEVALTSLSCTGAQVSVVSTYADGNWVPLDWGAGTSGQAPDCEGSVGGYWQRISPPNQLIMRGEISATGRESCYFYWFHGEGSGGARVCAFYKQENEIEAFVPYPTQTFGVVGAGDERDYPVGPPV